MGEIGISGPEGRLKRNRFDLTRVCNSHKILTYVYGKGEFVAEDVRGRRIEAVEGDMGDIVSTESRLPV